MTIPGKQSKSVGLIVEVDPQGDILRLNSVELPMDLIDKPGLGHSIFAYLHPDNQEAFAVNLEWVSNGPERSVKLQVRFRKSQHWWISVDVTLSNISDGHVLVTASENLAGTQEIKEGQFQALVEASNQGSIVFGQSGAVFLNVGYANLVGYDTIEELVESGSIEFTDLVHPDDMITLVARITAAENGEDVSPGFEFRLRQKNGEYRWMDSQSSEIVWNGEPSFLSWVSDATDRKKSEEDALEFTTQLNNAKQTAEKANLAKSEFLAKMSHEIRTPLNGVIGMSEVLKMSNLDEKQIAMADVIESSGRNLLDILNDILDLSKLEAGHADVYEERADLEDIVSTSLRVMMPVAEEKSLALNTEVNPDVPISFMCDVGKLQQILRNFIGNALKFTHEGSVTLCVSKASMSDGKTDGVCFSVIDTGIGISPENMSKLFNRFIQADNSTSRQFGGTGLGLAINKELAILMEGEVGCESVFEEGTTFWITLPANAAEYDTPYQSAKVN